ncbi:MAG: hypothetical protein MUE78_12570 [Ilumatobacteraceae bacterium]|jgi:hypothetical protein|nr:hypothetical protein [Ilumatobacteraceae bacterium]
MRRGVALVCALTVVAACGDDGSAQPVAVDAGDAVVGEVVLTRQRDLIDRGLVNVLTENRSGADIALLARRLDADHFDAPWRERSSTLRAGRRVALQVPYGTVTECDSSDPLTARLVLRTVTDDGSTEDLIVSLDGADVLAAIRASACAATSFDAAVDVSIESAEVVDGQLHAELVVQRRDDDVDVVVDASRGTVLVDAAVDALPAVLDDGVDALALPVTFTVNRCDPHALAEVTKRYGLDLRVAVDGAEPAWVPIDLAPVLDDLVAIVDDCIARS